MLSEILVSLSLDSIFSLSVPCAGLGHPAGQVGPRAGEDVPVDRPGEDVPDFGQHVDAPVHALADLADEVQRADSETQYPVRSIAPAVGGAEAPVGGVGPAGGVGPVGGVDVAGPVSSVPGGLGVTVGCAGGMPSIVTGPPAGGWSTTGKGPTSTM